MSCNSQSRPGIPNAKVRNQISIVLLLPIDDVVYLYLFSTTLQTNKMVKSFLLLWLFHLATVLSLSAGKHLAITCIGFILIFNSSLFCYWSGYYYRQDNGRLPLIGNSPMTYEPVGTPLTGNIPEGIYYTQTHRGARGESENNNRTREL